MALGTGDPAPDLTLEDDRGETVRLTDLRGRNVVVFFYPKNDTPVCTKESCAFRDAYEDFRGADAEVFGVSADDAASHTRFRDKHQLPYRLLSDRDRSAARAFGVPQRFGLMPARMTFVIDAEGVIRHVTHADLSAERHVKEALSALASLRSRP